jgi:hypothetical protein
VQNTDVTPSRQVEFCTLFLFLPKYVTLIDKQPENKAESPVVCVLAETEKTTLCGIIANKIRPDVVLWL